MACGFKHPFGCVDGIAQQAATSAFAGIARDFAHAAGSIITWLWGQLSAATAVRLGGPAFSLDVGILAAITGVVAVGLFAIQVATSALRRDPSGLARAIKGLAVAFLGGAAAIAVTNLLLGVIDALSAGVVKLTMGVTLDQMGPKVLGPDAITAISNPAGMFLLAVAAIAATVVIWAALLVRKTLIIISAVFAPLAFAGSLTDFTVSWTRRWIEIMAALIISKLLLVMIFVIGWGILEGAGQTSHGPTQAVTQTASGLLILTVAGFSPWMALKLVHFGGDHLHQTHLLARSATSGATTMVAAPQKLAAWQTTATRHLTPTGAHRPKPDHSQPRRQHRTPGPHRPTAQPPPTDPATASRTDQTRRGRVSPDRRRYDRDRHHGLVSHRAGHRRGDHRRLVRGTAPAPIRSDSPRRVQSLRRADRRGQTSMASMGGRPLAAGRRPTGRSASSRPAHTSSSSSRRSPLGQESGSWNAPVLEVP